MTAPKASASALSPLLGDYVLATKYSDGDPQDQWFVGFYDGERDGRHYVKNSAGQQGRANGFRRVKKISPERGRWMLQRRTEIERGARSVWWWVRASMTPNAG